MKIAFVTTSLKGGGAEKAILRTALYLQRCGVQVVVVAIEKVVEHYVDPSLSVHFLTKKMRGGLWHKLKLVLSLRLFLRSHGPFDRVISTLPRADEICRLARVPNLWFRIANTFSEELRFTEKRDPERAAKRRRRYKRFYDNANIIAVSQGVAEEMKSQYNCQTEVIYNPLERKELEALSLERAFLPSQPYLIHVSRFAPHKRHDLLFEAYIQAKLKSPLVLLTKPSKELHALIASYGLENSVIIAGFQQNPYPWIKQASLLIHTSEYEGMPNVVIEALLLKCPVVCTDCQSGPRELLAGELREFLVPCNDSRKLAFAMRKALIRYPPIGSDIDKLFHPERLFDAYCHLGQTQNKK